MPSSTALACSAWFIADDATGLHPRCRRQQRARRCPFHRSAARGLHPRKFLGSCLRLSLRRITYYQLQPRGDSRDATCTSSSMEAIACSDHARRHVPHTDHTRNRSGPRTPLTNLSRFWDKKGATRLGRPFAWLYKFRYIPFAQVAQCRLPPSRAAASRDRASRSIQRK